LVSAPEKRKTSNFERGEACAGVKPGVFLLRVEIAPDINRLRGELRKMKALRWNFY